MAGCSQWPLHLRMRPASFHGRACPPRHSIPAVFQTPSRSAAPGPTGNLHEESETAEHQRKAAGKPWCRLAAYITRFPRPPRARCRPQITSTKCEGVKCSNSRLAATPALEGFERSHSTLKLRCNTASYKLKQTLLIPRARPIAAAPRRTEAHPGVNSCS